MTCPVVRQVAIRGGDGVVRDGGACVISGPRRNHAGDARSDVLGEQSSSSKPIIRHAPDAISSPACGWDCIAASPRPSKHESMNGSTGGLATSQDPCTNEPVHGSGRPFARIGTPSLRKGQLIKLIHHLYRPRQLPAGDCRFMVMFHSKVNRKKGNALVPGPACRLTGPDEQGPCLQPTRRLLIAS